jgi:hypothetical protein
VCTAVIKPYTYECDDCTLWPRPGDEYGTDTKAVRGSIAGWRRRRRHVDARATAIAELDVACTQRVQKGMLRRQMTRVRANVVQDDKGMTEGAFVRLMTLCSWVLIVLTFPISLFFCIQVIKEYERVVMFRLGRLKSGGPRGPGIFFYLPCMESFRKVSRLV